MKLYGQASNRGETRVGRALTYLPGIAITNLLATSKNRTREIDWLVITPTAIAAIEVKGTRQHGTLTTALNGDWTINNTKADFAGGPNPLNQTRKAAATARNHLDAANTALGHYVHAICVITGDITVTPHTQGDVWICTPDQLAGVLMRLRAHPLTITTARAVTAAFGTPVPPAVVAAENFPTHHTPKPATHSSTHDTRRQARRTAMEHTANRLWERAHTRRVVLSGLGAATSLIYLATRSWQAMLAGIGLAAVIGAWQLITRHRLPGQRKHGIGACVIWIITLTPYIGAGAAIVNPLLTHLSPTSPDTLLLVDAVVSWLIALLLFLTTLSGRCGFIYPPPVVVERHDAKHRPTGLFMLAQPDGKQRSINLTLVDTDDPRSRTYR